MQIVGRLLSQRIGAGVRADLEGDQNPEMAPKILGSVIIVVKKGIFKSSANYSRKGRMKKIIRKRREK